MPSTVQVMVNKNLISPPKWLSNNVHYETMMGSVAYGVSSDSSDCDVYGFVIPPKHIVFPHLVGHIMGFGDQGEKFDQFQAHHIKDKESRKEYDFAIFNIVKYFHLCMQNNPNCVDSLYTPDFCVLHITKIGQMMRENRDIFLHKGAFHRFKGYAHSQLHKMQSKNPSGKRKELVEQFGFDTKFAYHIVRLADECEQILTTGTINLQRAKEHMKAIRKGEVSEEDIRRWWSEKEIQLEKFYAESKLPYKPDQNKIKELLLQCLETHYGSLDKALYVPERAEQALRDIKVIIDKYVD